jgi:putative transcriptional regulator
VVLEKAAELMNKSDVEKMSVFEQIKAGMEDALAFAEGKLSLVTIELPAPPPEVSAREVSRLRKQLRMSQSLFAATLNVSPRTVQSWEQGRRKPSDASLRLLQLVSQDPSIVQKMVFPADPKPKRTRAPRREP